MNYYIDTEFLEGTQKTWWGGKTKPTIDLISIGIVTENNKEYYAISKEFNLKEAWNRYDLNCGSGYQRNLPTQKVYWIRENVLKPIWCDLFKLHGRYPNKVDALYAWDKMKNYQKYTYLKLLILKYGKTNKQIAEEVKYFCLDKYVGIEYDLAKDIKFIDGLPTKTLPVFYGYYADYDWVAFCWLFGTMINLPNGFPKYCKDLKQISDEVYQQKKKEVLDEAYKKGMKLCFLNSLSEHLKYPKQTNEHNALADARWNRELHKFLNEL